MRFVIMQKFQQVEDFREELFNVQDKSIIYKQINMDRNEERFWGTSINSKLAKVISLSSVTGSNLMGQILMEYAEKINEMRISE